MPERNQAALDFLLTRRSRPAKTLQGPAPDRDALREILTAAARTPDHGKLEPWRFVVLEERALRRIGQDIRTIGADRGVDPEKIEKAALAFDLSPLAVVVIEAPKPTDKFPLIEQTYSAGAVCLSLLNAALAAGWGANWLSGWPSHDAPEMFGTKPGERIAGIIHIGTERAAPPERPRPDLDAITDWVSE
ncbi:nitroreductase family protein [Primorskyibacter sp. S187A]|uniref:nitroreductase family protein n=1 Tax=Primorskyibacter sp. S187A TaxID=3415130 RepID=UPI003C7B2391